VADAARVPAGATARAADRESRSGSPHAGDSVVDAMTADAARLPSRTNDVAARAWAAAFELAIAAVAARAHTPAVALGGGLDGAAVLAAWRASGVAMPAVVTIATGLPGYDEIAEACAIAASIGVRCEVIGVTPAQIVDAVPEAVPLGEAPLYNLHPVARRVLAREVARRGHDVLVTGDGGDAVFAGRPDHDYVPIVAAYTTASLRVASPYFAPAVIAATRPDPDRRVLRDYVIASGLPDRPKRRRMMPALDLGALVDRERIGALATQLDLPPAADVRWVTLDYLVSAFE
jgi:asparagine synthetase B (glutamine-hydrolysing)